MLKLTEEDREIEPDYSVILKRCPSLFESGELLYRGIYEGHNISLQRRNYSSMPHDLVEKLLNR